MTTRSDAEGITVLRVAQNGEPLAVSVDASPGRVVAIEIPSGINRLLEEDLEVAWCWRQASRDVFTKLIGAGFVVAEFHLSEGPQGRVGKYRLEAASTE